MGIAVGIDLGTTFSAIAHINEYNKPEIIRNNEDKPLTPSVVAVCETPPVVGDEAKELQASGEEGVASFFKRAMGNRSWIFESGTGSYTATDLSALVVGKLKTDAEARLKQPITDAVITVPAYFNNDQREATKAAGEAAGLNVLMAINEPTAAALAFGLGGGRVLGRILVYDLGGGTFDVTLIEIGKQTMDVLATDGDHELGGKDWDDRLANFVAAEFHEEHGENPVEDRVSYNDIVVASEQAKISLTDMRSTKMRITHEGLRAAYAITREQFDEMTQDLLERTTMLTEGVLDAQKLSWRDLQGVLLVGGSTRMPMVKEFMVSRSGKEPITGVNVDEAVAVGAAIQASKMIDERSGKKVPRLPQAKEFRDVTSHSLGVVALNETRDGYLNKFIIRKNSRIPCVESEQFQLHTRPGQDNQVDVFMLQGESEDPADCHVVGKYSFSNVSHIPGYAAVIDIEYGYDQNGIISVAARERSTGKELPLTVEPLAADMSWLSEAIGPEQRRGKSPYTPWAGQQRIPGAMTDDFGNPLGAEYDLVEDGAFEGRLIAVLHLYTGEGFDFKAPEAALMEKGFRVHRWTSVPGVREFAKVLDNACQLWLISDATQHLTQEHLNKIAELFASGRGLYVWGDNQPYYADANYVASALLGCTMAGNTMGNQVVRPQTQAGAPGFVSHLITTGVEYLYEGITIATIQAGGRLQPLMYGSSGNLLIATHDEGGKRAIIDGGFTRLYCNWDTAGTGRYVKNAAGWLVNFERFGL